MSKSKFPRIIDVCLAAFILMVGVLCFSPDRASAQAQSLATITTARGTVEVRHGAAGGFKAVRAQASLAAGDVLRTGANSGAAILYNDGTQIRVGASASLEITPPTAVRGNTSFFKLLVGEVWARLRPGRAGQTKYANLVVRGTDIHLVVSEAAATLTVLEGQVEFFNTQGSVVVNGGQQSLAEEGKAPTTPITIANPGLTVEWRFQLDRTQIARDRYFATASRRQAADLVRDLTAKGVSATNGTPADRVKLAAALHDAGRDEDASNIFQGLSAADLAALPQDMRWSVDRQAADVFAALDDDAKAEARLRGGLNDNTRPAPQRALLSNGLGWLALDQNKPEDATTAAKASLALSPNDPEARLVLGLAQLRSGDQSGAKETLQALANDPTAPVWGPPIAPQASAWTALITLSDGDTAKAATLSAAAVTANPASGVAHAAASLVAFTAGDTGRAAREARISTDLDPDSVTGVLALAQSELARGNLDKAGAAAARATALDPEFPEAFYVLGVADAGRRDYVHAERSLREALKLDPGYAPAAAALARVEIRAGRPGAALAFLNDWKIKNETTPQITAALGEAYFRLAKYNESLAQFRQLATSDPNSALGWAGLCRVALDANRLNEAIRAGQKAVRLAPNVGEYHAILGLAYRFSRLDGQADREFRTALALDPQNALALVQLGLGQQDSSKQLTDRNTFVNTLQAFFLDPTISRDLLRGGTNGNITPFAGDQTGIGAAARTTTANGKINAFGQAFDSSADIGRENSNQNLQTGLANVNLTPSAKTNIVIQANRNRNKYDVPGKDNAPATDDDKAEFRADTGSVGLRQAFGDKSTLWLNLFSRAQNERRTNPGLDDSSVFAVSFVRPSTPDGTTSSRSLTPELRYDFSLGNSGHRPGQFTFGYARPRSQSRFVTTLFRPNFGGGPGQTGFASEDNITVSEILYGQVTKQVTNDLGVSVQLRHQNNDLMKEQRAVFSQLVNINTGPIDTENSRWLPSGVLNYRLGGQTNLRFSGSRRFTDAIPSSLAPLDTLINTERSALVNGLAATGGLGTLTSYQMDLEHYGSAGDLAKLFLFHSAGDNIIYDFSQYANTQELNKDGNLERNFMLFDSIKRTGVGLRYERPLSSSLFTQLGATYASTTASGRSLNPLTGLMEASPWSGQAAPYHPRFTAFASVNYLTPSGYKFQLRGNYTGEFYRDTQKLVVASRPKFGATTTYDLLLSHEPTVRNEYFLQITNLFGTRQIIYNGITYNPRQVTVGWTKRF